MNISVHTVHRDISKLQLYAILNHKSVTESLLDTVTDCFYLRDHRHGRGERKLGRMCFNWLADMHPAIFLKLLRFIPEYGRWDDLLYITNPQVTSYIYAFLYNQLNTDRWNMAIGLPISPLAKWLPTEGKAFARKKKIQFQTILRHLKVTPQEYRTQLSALRKYLQLPEHIVCTPQSDEAIITQLTSRSLPRGATRKYNKVYAWSSPTKTLNTPLSTPKQTEQYTLLVNHLKM